MKHPHAEILKAYAEDTSVQIEARYTDGLGEKWHPARIEDVLKPSLLHTYEYRIKPAMRHLTTQDGTVVEWPEPMRVAPAEGTLYWCACTRGVSDMRWTNHSVDCELLKAGVCHLTEEAAQQHRKALVLANGGEL